jgi:hypothetical protein
MIESKTLQSSFNKDLEEINKVHILCIARSFIITGDRQRYQCAHINTIRLHSGSESNPQSWCGEFLNTVMQNTQHSWSSWTLDAMPSFMAEWYRKQSIPDAYRDVRTRVDEDYKKLTSTLLNFVRKTIHHIIRTI